MIAPYFQLISGQSHNHPVPHIPSVSLVRSLYGGKLNAAETLVSNKGEAGFGRGLFKSKSPASTRCVSLVSFCAGGYVVLLVLVNPTLHVERCLGVSQPEALFCSNLPPPASMVVASVYA